MPKFTDVTLDEQEHEQDRQKMYVLENLSNIDLINRAWECSYSKKGQEFITGIYSFYNKTKFVSEKQRFSLIHMIIAGEK